DPLAAQSRCGGRAARFAHMDSMLCAGMTSARGEKACGELPTWRCSVGAYSSGRGPRGLRSASKRSNSASASEMRPATDLVDPIDSSFAIDYINYSDCNYYTHPRDRFSR